MAAVNRLDRIDRKIIRILQRDARITNQALSDQVGLSPTPCLRRVRALEEAGFFTAFAALVDPAMIGLGVTVFIRVRLERQDDVRLREFEAAIQGLPQVMECYLMTGDSDYQLRVVVGSMEEFEAFLRRELTRIPGVAGITSSFALRPIVTRTELPIPQS